MCGFVGPQALSLSLLPTQSLVWLSGPVTRPLVLAPLLRSIIVSFQISLKERWSVDDDEAASVEFKVGGEVTVKRLT